MFCDQRAGLRIFLGVRPRLRAHRPSERLVVGQAAHRLGKPLDVGWFDEQPTVLCQLLGQPSDPAADHGEVDGHCLVHH